MRKRTIILLVGLSLLFTGGAIASSLVPLIGCDGSACKFLSANSVSTNVQGSLPVIPAFSAYSAIHCADAVNGNDSNTGVASGTYPNFTNCKKTLNSTNGLATIITASSWNGLTGTFRDATIANVQKDMLDIPTTAVGGTSSVPTLITSYGPALFNDPISGASGGAIIDGADCLGTNTGNCANMPNTPPTWILVSGSIYSTPYAAPISAVYLDNITTWEDGSTPNTTLSGGLTEASCLSGTCAGSTTASSMLPYWASGHSGGYAAGTAVQSPATTNPPPSWWYTSAGCSTGGTTNPTYASGMVAGTSTVSDGQCTWTFEGVGGGKIGAMSNSANGGSWYWNGTTLYVELATGGGSPSTHVIEATNHIYDISMFYGTAPNNNFIYVGHIEMRHAMQDGMEWNNTSSTVCPNGNVWFDNFITQTGPSDVELNGFGNGFRFTDYASTAASPVNCSTDTNVFIHNDVSYCGDHGGCVTFQTGQLPTTVAWNNISHWNHVGINDVGGGSIAMKGGNIVGNYVHDAFLPFNGSARNSGPASDSDNAIFIGTGGGPDNIVGNYVYDVYDPKCPAAQCDCFDLQYNSGSVTVENNTCDSSQEGLYTNRDSPGVIFKGNICSNLTAAVSTGTCIITHSTTELNASDYNVVTTGANGLSFNGTIESLATWQGNTGAGGAKYDLHSVAQNPTYINSWYPYILQRGSYGLGMTLGVGLFGENAGANPIVNGWQQ